MPTMSAAYFYASDLHRSPLDGMGLAVQEQLRISASILLRIF